MGYAGFEGIQYLRAHADMPNGFKPKMAHLQRSDRAINIEACVPIYYPEGQMEAGDYVNPGPPY